MRPELPRDSCIFIAFLALISLGACASPPVRSTVDAFGETTGPARATTLCFLREGVSLRDRPAVDACEKAAKDRGIRLAAPGEAGCEYVVVTTGVSEVSQQVRSGSNVSVGVGLYRGWGYGGLGGIGMPTGSIETKEIAARALRVEIYRDRERKVPVHSIEVRSAGREISALAVAPEMCEAAFRDYPSPLQGKIYEIKPHPKE